MNIKYQVVKLDKISPSEQNYRRSYDETKMEELVASIKEQGIIEPLVVRPLNGNGTFEIVVGHRRYNAASLANLEVVPVVVRELTDEEVLEIQVVENSQREDPNPIDEALGFKRLLDTGHYNAETIATKIGHSISYVLGRLRLLYIPEEAQEMLMSGEVSLGHALLLTRYRHASDQENLLAIITEDTGITVKEAESRLERMSPSLEEAEFNCKECEACQYRSRNQTNLFPQLEEASDDCMDIQCYKEKTYAHYQSIVDERAEQGFKILMDPEEVEKLLSWQAKNSCAIAAKSQYYRTKRPKRYKTECMKCQEFHAWYLFTFTPPYGNREELRFGEICLNKKCLEKMERARGDSDGNQGGESQNEPISFANPEKARLCRDRFLKSIMPGKVAVSPVAQKRLLIFNLLLQYKPLLSNLEKMNDLFPEFREEMEELGWWGASDIYHCVMSVPLENLDNVLQGTLVASLGETYAEILLLASPEAGVDFSTEFAVDEEFLRGKTKAALVELIRELWPDKESRPSELQKCVEKDTKKGEMISTILAQDLIGKIPEEIVKECGLVEAHESDDESEGLLTEEGWVADN